MSKRPATPFFIFKEEFKKEFEKNKPNKRRFSVLAGERWKILSDLDKAPYVLKAQTQKKRGEDGIEGETEESDKPMVDRSEFDKSESTRSESDKVGSEKSMSDKPEFDMSESDKSEFDKSESDKFGSVKSECEVIDEHEEGSNSGKVNDDDDIKWEIEEDELKTIITDFARFEEAFTPVKHIDPPKATNLHKHLDELEKLISLPLETLLQSANLIRLQNILKLVKDLPLVDDKLREWCNTLFGITMTMPKQRIDIQKVLMETEAKAETMVQLQKEATDIRKAALQDLQLQEEYSTNIQSVDAKIENLKRQLVEAEAERATLVQLEGDLAVGKYQRLKRARIVHNGLAPLIDQNGAINKIILDSKNTIKNIDCHLNALIIQFNVLKNAA